MKAKYHILMFFVLVFFNFNKPCLGSSEQVPLRDYPSKKPKKEDHANSFSSLGQDSAEYNLARMFGRFNFLIALESSKIQEFNTRLAGSCRSIARKQILQMKKDFQENRIQARVDSYYPGFRVLDIDLSKTEKEYFHFYEKLVAKLKTLQAPTYNINHSISLAAILIESSLYYDIYEDTIEEARDNEESPYYEMDGIEGLIFDRINGIFGDDSNIAPLIGGVGRLVGRNVDHTPLPLTKLVLSQPGIDLFLNSSENGFITEVFEEIFANETREKRIIWEVEGGSARYCELVARSCNVLFSMNSDEYSRAVFSIANNISEHLDQKTIFQLLADISAFIDSHLRSQDLKGPIKIQFELLKRHLPPSICQLKGSQALNAKYPFIYGNNWM